MIIGVEEEKVVIEVISTLVHIKSTLVELILKPAGVPPEVYTPVFNKRDPITGRSLSKRKVAPLIIDGLKNHPRCQNILFSIIKIAAKWSEFSLANDEYEARATVQKAQDILSRLVAAEENERLRVEIARKLEGERRKTEKQAAVERESRLLLSMFDDLSRDQDHQRRGLLLEDLLNRLFRLHEITVYRGFLRNQGGEQIDGAFKLEGWHYIVECRWRDRLADIRQLDGLLGQVGRSGKQTSGLFLSMNGWSENVVPLLKQNPDKSIFLMDGYDLRCVLSGVIDHRDFLLTKIAKFNLETEPFYGATEYLKTLEGN